MSLDRSVALDLESSLKVWLWFANLSLKVAAVAESPVIVFHWIHNFLIVSTGQSWYVIHAQITELSVQDFAKHWFRREMITQQLEEFFANICGDMYRGLYHSILHLWYLLPGFWLLVSGMFFW